MPTPEPRVPPDVFTSSPDLFRFLPDEELGF